MIEERTEKTPLVKKIGLYFLGNFSTKIIGTLLIPLYAIYVKPAELGQIDLQQNIASIVSPIIVIGIWESILKFGLSESDDGKSKVLNTTFFYVLISSAISFFLILPVYLKIGYSPTLSFLYTLLIVSTPIYSVFQYYTRMYQQNKLFVKSSVISSIVRFILLIGTIVIMNLGILGLILSLLGSQLFLVIYLWIGLKINAKIEKSEFDKLLLMKMLKFSFPLAINLISLWFLSGFTRMYINYEYGSDANGIYTFGLQCASLISMVGQVVNMATLEETLSSKKENFASTFENYTDKLISLFFDAAIIMMPTVSIFFILISKSSFSDSFLFVPILVLNAIVVTVASSFNNVFQYKGSTKYIFFTTVISAIVNIVMAVFLNKSYGIRGIVIAQLLGSISLLCIRYLLINKEIGYRFKYKDIIISFILFLLASYFSLILNIYISIIFFGIFFIILFLKNKKIIMYYYKKVCRLKKK
ncbi:lipopolysaccharide biosynthesis protein [Vagococcus fluvialis]|uniref:Oligosaccharide flippase family protein n=1 Tax=Vagococcus fluvialis TaxID=2738 RepID=A0A7X6D7H9_9ENTE|nr:oligosaccharide flippase family protein [Vagococcus fluvialis]NKC66918.1 oligosaccharide flippase family protein [Vagococcus fluvialis]